LRHDREFDGSQRVKRETREKSAIRSSKFWVRSSGNLELRTSNPLPFRRARGSARRSKTPADGSENFAGYPAASGGELHSVTRQTGSHLRLTTYEHGEHHLKIPLHYVELRTSSRVSLSSPFPLFSPVSHVSHGYPAQATYIGFATIGVSPHSGGTRLRA